MRARRLAAAAAVALLLCAGGAGAKRYKAHEKVVVSVNKAGPFNNPTETYPFYSLPYCRPEGKTKQVKHNIGEYLIGDRKMNAGYDITFNDDIPWRTLCTQTLQPEDVEKFADAIEHDYYFEMFVDDLPMWGFVGIVQGNEVLVGHIEGSRVLIFPHVHFTFGKNGNQIVSATLSTNPERAIEIPKDPEASGPQDIIFSYSVEWVEESNLKYEDRMSRYHDSTFLPTTFEIHWLSIINSFVLVLLLTAFLSVILMRVLRNDFSRYMEEEYGAEDPLNEDETGWKLINGDVFRTPQFPLLLSAVSGAGAQLCATVVLVLIAALCGMFRATKRGAVVTAFLVAYSITAFLGGLVAGRLYRQLDGRNWVWNIVCTYLVFPAPLFVVFCFVNTTALAHGSLAALPVTTILVVLAVFVFVVFPPTIVGGIVGRNTTVRFEPPCRTKKQPREIPRDGPWFHNAALQLFMAGLLPFSAIYVELHYIFASIWGHKVYTLFGILSLAFLMLYIVTSFITVALIYFQLAREDYHWWWRSFFCGGMTGLFIYAYSFFYYFNRSSLSGVLQSSFFFGYMGIIAYAFALMLGYIGFSSSFSFVKHIYSIVKAD
mmetsp:Transcript_26490/g.82733  ORF Transcript_26490/g.82733 Transcript_26490/m.82733 type:complete len:600 (+) Transcript_26490:2207-4006(+)